MLPGCDNDCVRLGWKKALLDLGDHDEHVSFDPKTVERDISYNRHIRVFNHDEQALKFLPCRRIISVELLN